MRKLIIMTVVAAMAVGCGSSCKTGKTVPANGTVTTIGVDEFTKTIARKDVKLVDVRTAKEFDDGHIAGAENIDVNAADFVQNVRNLNGKVAVYCRSGKRSLKAAGILAEQGCTVYNLDGGIMAWQSAGKPVQ